jgi:hypothetical protein
VHPAAVQESCRQQPPPLTCSLARE